jgi:hypothetical protein
MQRSLNSSYVMSSLVMAVGVTSPFMFTKVSWAQTINVAQPNQALYYGWQTQADEETSKSETALEIAGGASTNAVNTEVIFEPSEDANVAVKGSAEDFPSELPRLHGAVGPSAALLKADWSEPSSAYRNRAARCRNA